MQGATREHWQELCEQAAKEHDPDKMIALISEINRLLDEKYTRLATARQKDDFKAKWRQLCEQAAREIDAKQAPAITTSTDRLPKDQAAHLDAAAQNTNPPHEPDISPEAEETWHQLLEQAAKEDDPVHLATLVATIERLVHAEEAARLKASLLKERREASLPDPKRPHDQEP